MKTCFEYPCHCYTLLLNFEIQKPLLICNPKTDFNVNLEVTSPTHVQHMLKEILLHMHSVTHLAGWACL